jgi:hypothetical protein
MFVAKTPFQSSHPDTLAVYCSDGRFARAVEELAEHLGHARIDELTLPGGPAILDPWSASALEADQFGRAAGFLVRSHGIRHAILIAHAGCGYYRQRYLGQPAAETRQKQLVDLRAAARALGGAHRGLELRLYYAVAEGGRVRFEPVEAGT